MDTIVALLKEQPLLLLFLVAAIGYPLGLIRVAGSSLGVSAVLFVGLAFGALDPELRVPPVIYELGLMLFVYNIGLSSGPGFFRAFRSGGLRNNLLVGGMLLFASALAVSLSLGFQLPPAEVAGLFAGGLTNTPALAGVVEALKLNGASEAVQAQPVVGYSIAYPMGVLGVILVIQILTRVFKVDYRQEARQLKEMGGSAEDIVNITVRVTRADIAGVSVGELVRGKEWHALFSRLQHAGEEHLVKADTTLVAGDLVSVIGTEADVLPVVDFLGERAPDVALNEDRGVYDYRRVFVSNHQLFGRRLSELSITERLGALVTRVRRGDLDLLATGNTVLEPGDRVRVVAPRDRMREVGKFFGDSYKALSEIDILSFSLGLVIGVLLGQVPVPLPGGGVFRLGNAGGPLVVAIILGWRERTGPLVWTIPYSANLTLRQIGIVMFLAGVGTRSGYAFFQTLAGANGLPLFLGGLLITCGTATVALIVGHKVLKIPFSLLIGMVSGMQTQPALLTFSAQQTGNEVPNMGYASVYPVAMVLKIVLAQIILVVLGGGV
ncbi:MAG TPA: aspartate:alanine exchanger family transporter [Anaerolineales bacterium]|nr:aspartate:alanine exchanger family transporter [Anaerolineales bacterium]